ncbi:MAG: cytidine deaminase [Lachnospiraceae bacterium]|nr:cytidine deaminase [Lachnospiraceae bacterium]
MNGIENKDKELIKWAFAAAGNAYCPYSHFHVGAALRTVDDTVYLGCNIENSSYGATNCAERTAIFKAVSDGCTDFKEIAIVGFLDGKEPEDYAYPCGICRQVMSEFCGRDFRIIVAKSENDYKVYTLDQLLPESFGADNIK